MEFRVLFDHGTRKIEINSNVSDAPSVNSLESIVDRVQRSQETLTALSIDDIIGLCDAVAQSWSRSNHPLAPLIRELSLGFIPLWMRRSNLESLCDLSLNGNRFALDRFISLSEQHETRLFRCQPRGLIVHWIAGNVPVLGMISLIQGILGKNATIVKASRHDAGLLPALLDSFKDVTYISRSGQKISADILTNSVAVIYSEKDDIEAARYLSTIADVRVAWGGREAVESIMNLPRRFGTEDIIFGPKVSFIVVGIEYLCNEASARQLAKNIVKDVSAFDQRGCNSPHTVFVEKGGLIKPNEFTRIVAEEMDFALANRSLHEVQPGDTMNILGVRAEYDMRGDAYYSNGMGWTVVYSGDDKGLATPCYLRTLFVRPVNDIFDVVSLCSINTQTAGLAVKDRHIRLADALTQKGIERCPVVGGMSLYASPWDGMFPVSRMVRWVSTTVDPNR
ncbi:acyl-CoA reductase [Methylotuvimicrobium sp.]|uniref:acyl-CoA reductase n=1 Tax=Methylotuvimicrobium sp. TaxID=2822413 RepID=UPI003D657291